jgi:hypothetical protein
VQQLITTSGEVFLFLDNRFSLSTVFQDKRILGGGKMVPNQNDALGIFARDFEKAAGSWKCATNFTAESAETAEDRRQRTDDRGQTSDF